MHFGTTIGTPRRRRSAILTALAKKKREREAVDSWADYQRVIDQSPEQDFAKRVRDADDDLYAARVIACAVLGTDASEDAILRVSDAIVRRQAVNALRTMKKPDEIT